MTSDDRRELLTTGRVEARGFTSEQKRDELAARRTGMSFQRTRLSAERTLMSVIRTALALIGFGFSIFQFFSHLQELQVLPRRMVPAHFGELLVILGIGMLLFGIGYHLSFMIGLRRERLQMKEQALVHADSQYPVSLTLLVALLLLLVGLFAIGGMLWKRGPLARARPPGKAESALIAGPARVSS